MDVQSELDRVADQRPATRGRPEDGPYPATVGEVADEVIAWMARMDRSAAAGLTHTVLVKLISVAVDRTERA